MGGERGEAGRGLVGHGEELRFGFQFLEMPVEGSEWGAGHDLLRVLQSPLAAAGRGGSVGGLRGGREDGGCLGPGHRQYNWKEGTESRFLL